MITLYDSRFSLNCYKVRLLLALLGVPYTRQPVDIRKGEHRAPELLARYPFGQIPVLDTGALALRDSQAILVWLARRHGNEQWMPTQPEDEALVNAWLAASAYELRLGPYEARLRKRAPFLCVTGDTQANNTERALQLFEERLRGRQWLALDHPTVADIAAFPSLAHAGDGDVDLGGCPGILAWLDRVRGLPGFVGLLD
ncbi:MAG: glutathione S-transferase family protein [Burkholderiaceae bacterium]|nr:glutathione S-transferase family protein [Burkholderiaceae bacterium]